MAKPPIRDTFFLEGPAGPLEAILETPADADASAVAVVLHPHPQHEGTMHNKVAHTLARSFVGMGFATLRFNFRGTGESAGEFAEGVGELADAEAAIAWMCATYPALSLWIAGFSFGAAIAVHAAVATAVDGLVSVAPAIRRTANTLTSQPTCPWLIVQGDEDELVDIEETIEWLNGLESGPELHVIEGAEHFFHGRLIDLREAVSEFVERQRS
jgi:alpha/beta superfamily hydrolase